MDINFTQSMIFPKRSYTIWFSQRNGSTLLCEGLAATGVAGKPGEHLLLPPETSLLEQYEAEDHRSLQRRLWQRGLTDNGVFGIKCNAPRKEDDAIMRELARMVGLAPSAGNVQIWEKAFPNGKHIFLTRRHKLRQAVSWWKAIVTNEWHRRSGQQRNYDPAAIRERYDFAALRHLLLEISLRESKIQAFLDEGAIVPLTVAYEDLIREYETTIRRVIDFLDIDAADYEVTPPALLRQADALSDEWTERFRRELQRDWPVVIW